MTEKVLATKQIAFGSGSDDPVDLNRPITAEITKDENPNGTRFFIQSNGSGEIVFITVISDPPVISSQSNYGSLSRSYTKVKDVEEFIAFTNSDSASLSSIPKSRANLNWEGSHFNTSSIVQDGKSLKMSQPGTGLLKATYQIDAIIYQLQNGQDPSLVTFVNEDNNTASVQIRFLPEECDTPVNDVVIVVADSITGNAIDKAAVRVNGTSVGSTGSDGKVQVGRLIRGQLNTLDIIKTGYQRPGEDCLDNSDFTL